MDFLCRFSTRIRDAGIAICHPRGRILFCIAGSRNELERVVGDGPGHKKKHKSRFVIEKYIEHVKPDEKHDPDLLGAITRPTCLVKEELRPIVFTTMQIMSKIKKKKTRQGFNFLDSRNPKFSRRRPMPAFSLVSFKQETAFHIQ